LDADESEPISSFDIDKANEQGQYVPKWYHPIIDNARPLSLLGYDLNPISSKNLIVMADTVLSQRVQSRSVLLDGYTDPPGQKITNNGFDFSGSVQWNDVPKGIFICALGLLPLFATTDLKPCTATSGWLSFTQPVSNDHIILVYPKDSVQDPDGRDSSPDNRIEVICAKTGCHLGHYFGKDGGYCINASCLNFLPSPRDSVSAHVRKLWTEDPVDSYVHSGRLTPVSWKRFMAETLSPCDKLLLSVIQENASFIRVALGAGCFWHVEYALSRLPGVVHTVVGFAGGPKEVVKPSYAHVSKGDTGHAEMVLVTFDPQILSPNELFDCFFAMHDPTMVRAHGKRSQGSGQYRSCIMVNTDEMRLVADRAWNECQRSLGLGLSTEIVQVADIDERFWPAEDRHQLYEQRVKGRESSTLTLEQWMVEYARRSSSIWGSAETLTIAEDDDSDDGLARFLI
jgi:peptide-methionine (S)-S-oxide reductase